MNRFMTILAAVLLAGWARASAADTDAEASAVKAAQTWLAKVDSGQYPESWDDAAEPFRSAVKKEQWPEMLRKVRTPLGKVVERKLLSKKYTESLPNAPPGKYVVIQFETKFANKTATETITPMLDKDGKWRVSGYYIK